ncbi:MAG: PaaI family thioesterase [Solirubrobacterales bacterium]
MNSPEAAQEFRTARPIAEELSAAMPEASRSLTVSWQDPIASAARGMEMSGLDYIQGLITGEIPPPPIAVLLDMGPVEIEEGRVVFGGKPGEEHYNPIGMIHGGYAATILDSALGCSVHTTLEKGTSYTSLGLEVKYVRPITRDTGYVLCESKVTFRGRRQATAEAHLTSAETGKLLASGTSTCLIMGPA